MILSEKKLRKVIREEFERLMSPPEPSPNITHMTHITSLSGGEIIMPNYTKEMFDQGKIKSMKDIL